MHVTVWNSVYVDEANSKGILLVSWHMIPTIVITPILSKGEWGVRVMTRGIMRLNWCRILSPHCQSPWIYNNRAPELG